MPSTRTSGYWPRYQLRSKNLEEASSLAFLFICMGRRMREPTRYGSSSQKSLRTRFTCRADHGNCSANHRIGWVSFQLVLAPTASLPCAWRKTCRYRLSASCADWCWIKSTNPASLDVYEKFRILLQDGLPALHLSE